MSNLCRTIALPPRHGDVTESLEGECPVVTVMLYPDGRLQMRYQENFVQALQAEGLQLLRTLFTDTLNDLERRIYGPRQ